LGAVTTVLLLDFLVVTKIAWEAEKENPDKGLFFAIFTIAVWITFVIVLAAIAVPKDEVTMPADRWR